MTDATPPPRNRIKTQRLVLRKIRMRDLAAFHKLVSSKDVTKYWYIFLKNRVLIFCLKSLL